MVRSDAADFDFFKLGVLKEHLHLLVVGRGLVWPRLYDCDLRKPPAFEADEDEEGQRQRDQRHGRREEEHRARHRVSCCLKLSKIFVIDLFICNSSSSNIVKIDAFDENATAEKIL